MSRQVAAPIAATTVRATKAMTQLCSVGSPSWPVWAPEDGGNDGAADGADVGVHACGGPGVGAWNGAHDMRGQGAEGDAEAESAGWRRRGR
jgi:hypothetical protein